MQQSRAASCFLSISLLYVICSFLVHNELILQVNSWRKEFFFQTVVLFFIPVSLLVLYANALSGVLYFIPISLVLCANALVLIVYGISDIPKYNTTIKVLYAFLPALSCVFLGCMNVIERKILINWHRWWKLALSCVYRWWKLLVILWLLLGFLFFIIISFVFNNFKSSLLYFAVVH